MVEAELARMACIFTFQLSHLPLCKALPASALLVLRICEISCKKDGRWLYSLQKCLGQQPAVHIHGMSLCF